MRAWLLDRVPRCLRSRRPFRRWFWQQHEIDEIERRKAALSELFS